MLDRLVHGRGGGRTSVLAALLIVQSIAAVFFVGDVVADLSFDGFDAHIVFEAIVAAALVIGVLLGGLEMRRTLDRARRSEAAVAAASGALGELIDAYFKRWNLTPAETDVAMLALKGFDVAEIASLRQAASGTVRAQLTRIYAKAGVSNRAQLVSIFIEDLLGGPVQASGDRRAG